MTQFQFQFQKGDIYAGLKRGISEHAKISENLTKPVYFIKANSIFQDNKKEKLPCWMDVKFSVPQCQVVARL